MSIDRDQYLKIRMNAGLFDASHTFGRLFARGKDAIDLLHRMSTNDMKPLEQGKNVATLTFLTNEKGRMIDLMKAVRDGAGETLLITSAGKEDAVIQWLDKFTIMEDAHFERATEKTHQLLLCGPNATSIISQYTNQDLSESRTQVHDLHFESAPATLVKGPSVAGNGWFILASAEHASVIWDQLVRDVIACEGAIMDGELFEVLRIENGTPITPNEINDKHNPLETPVASVAVSFTKGCYIGQEVIARLDAQDKVQRKLVGLKFTEGVPQVADRISMEALTGTPLGDEIGDVTSVANSPVNGAIGLGYIRAKYANPGAVVSVKDSTGNKLPATLVQLPFNA
ncbi:MAG TPA: glycine cleavage T C-terminal barrel domain-containing protein [Candidatus Kapabacteria bacterium]|nr:glycine cleavage T C-terminal barrel domain-containing protein [Candidatus Kapabacteria bacterium]